MAICSSLILLKFVSFSSLAAQKFLDILPDHIGLKVYGVSGLFEAEGGLTGGVRDDGDGEPLPLDLIDG